MCVLAGDRDVRLVHLRTRIRNGVQKLCIGASLALIRARQESSDVKRKPKLHRSPVVHELCAYPDGAITALNLHEISPSFCRKVSIELTMRRNGLHG